MSAGSKSRIGLVALAAGLMAALAACADPQPTPTPTAVPTATAHPGYPVEFLLIVPASVTLQVGQTQQFLVTAFDRFEKPYPDGFVPFEFEIVEGDGRISAGRFTATRTGTMIVSVTGRGSAGPRSATATITVEPAPPMPTPPPTPTPTPTPSPTPNRDAVLPASPWADALVNVFLLGPFAVMFIVGVGGSFYNLHGRGRR